MFLGEIASPPTGSQVRLLSKWDILVLDPRQNGVLDALSTERIRSANILGRLDVRTLAKLDTGSSDGNVIAVLDTIDRTLAALVGKEPQKSLTGVLLAGYRTYLQPAVLNETARYIHDLGLEVWLEIEPSSTTCPTERECRDTDMSLVDGIVYRNGTIRPDGDRQNYFQMADMRQVMRAVAAQRSRTVMVLWETIQAGNEQQYAVVQRTFNWCRFSNFLCWIGSETALTDADAAVQQTAEEKPLGALMWLKGEEIMKAHDTWRANDQVSASHGEVRVRQSFSAGRSLRVKIRANRRDDLQISPTTCTDIDDGLYDSLNSFVPGLREKLRQYPPSESHEPKDRRARSLPLRPKPDRGLESTESRHDDSDTQSHPLSVSAGGDDFTGLGCFHLGNDCCSHGSRRHTGAG